MNEGLLRLLQRSERRVAGPMSGTSLDGIDVAIARVSGSGSALSIRQEAFLTAPYPAALREALMRASAPETSNVYDLSQLNVRVAVEYAAAVREALDGAGLSTGDLDLVGSHGQTVHHVPVAADCAGRPTSSTLQIGDPSVLANLLGVPVVGDFRVADMALGGQGAPLVPYFDWCVFGSPDESRGLLNIGGIANLTVVPRSATAGSIYAFDTGPGNMVIDALAARYFGVAYDAGGALARQGRIAEEVLAELLMEPYFLTPPPKSTGRERFGAAFAERLVELGQRVAVPLSPHDILATATALTAYSVYQAYARFLRDRHALDVLVVAGGGAQNAFLMELLARVFSPIRVGTTADFGVDPDAKEALCFAVLAHECVNGVPTNVPTVTGASRPTILGKLCLPSPVG